MKFTRWICLLLTVFLLFGLSAVPAFAEEEEQPDDPSVSRGCRTVDGMSPLYGSEKLLETAEAAMLYEVKSDTVMYAWNPDMRVSPASLIKTVTCMVVLDKCDIQEKVTVTESALSTISKSAQTIKLLPGEVFTVDQMLYALMVGAANDAAVVLAEHVAGSQDAFVQLMNEKVQSLGCKDTVIVNVHGLHDDRQFTTARDQVRITREAIKNQQFMEYYSTTTYLVAATDQSPIRRVETTNYLITLGTELYYDHRVTGGRTGITNEGKRSIVVTAKSGGMEYVAVVLNTTSIPGNKPGIVKRFGSYEEAKELLSMGFESHGIYNVLYEGQVLTRYNVPNGRNGVCLGPVGSASVCLPEGTKMEELTLRFGVPNGAITAPVKAGEQITAVEVWYGSCCVAYMPVVTLNRCDVNTGPLLQDNRYGGNSRFFIIVLIVVVSAVVVAAAGIFGLRLYRILQHAKMQNRHKRRRSDRRRTK